MTHAQGSPLRWDLLCPFPLPNPKCRLNSFSKLSTSIPSSFKLHYLLIWSCLVSPSPNLALKKVTSCDLLSCYLLRSFPPNQHCLFGSDDPSDIVSSTQAIILGKELQWSLHYKVQESWRSASPYAPLYAAGKRRKSTVVTATLLHAPLPHQRRAP